MGFNNFNYLDIFSKLNQFNDFKKNILASGRDPKEILAEECQKRGITKEQLNQLTEMAKSLNNIIGR